MKYIYTHFFFIFVSSLIAATEIQLFYNPDRYPNHYLWTVWQEKRKFSVTRKQTIANCLTMIKNCRNKTHRISVSDPAMSEENVQVSHQI